MTDIGGADIVERWRARGLRGEGRTGERHGAEQGSHDDLHWSGSEGVSRGRIKGSTEQGLSDQGLRPLEARPLVRSRAPSP